MLQAWIAGSIREVMARLSPDTLVGIDIPIGLPARGSRACDIEARRIIGRRHASSVFPAPVRSCLDARTREDASRLHAQADGRRVSHQVFGLLGKIREVDTYLQADRARQKRLREVHPEVSFTFWNEGAPMRYGKSTAAGRREREALIERTWPGELPRARAALQGSDIKPDDVNDAFAALWTASRIVSGDAVPLSASTEVDGAGIEMQILA